MTAAFEWLPRDIAQLVIEFLRTRDIARLDSATGSPLRGFVIKFSRADMLRAITRPQFCWFHSRGNILERVNLDESNCLTLLDQDLTLRCIELYLPSRYLAQLTLSQWTQLWSKILRIDTISLSVQSDLDPNDHILTAPFVLNRLHTAVFSIDTVTPSRLLEIIGRCKNTLQSLKIYDRGCPLPEWRNYASAHDLTHGVEEWPMLKDLQIYCHGSPGAAVLMMCARNAVSLTKLYTFSAYIQSVDGAVALLQHQIWRPRNHILRIYIAITQEPNPSNRPSLLDVAPVWITDNPPITQWNMRSYHISDASPSTSLDYFVEFMSLLPQQQQQTLGVTVNVNQGFPFFSHLECYQSLDSITIYSNRNINDPNVSSTIMNWRPMWQSPCLRMLDFRMDKHIPELWDGILNSILSMAASSKSPPLETVCLAHSYGNHAHNSDARVSREDTITVFSSLASSFANTLKCIVFTNIEVNSATVAAFLQSCRLLKRVVIRDISVFDALPTAISLKSSSSTTTQQPLPKTRFINFGVRMPVDSICHAHVWSTIRYIANILNEHCSSYRDPTPKEMTVCIQAPHDSIITAGSQALVDMPYIKLSRAYDRK